MKSLHNISRIGGLLLLIAGLLSATTGCKDFLETERQGGYDAEDYPYPGGSGP